MKRLYILFVIGLALALSLSALTAYDPGYVRITFGPWLIESNLLVLVLLNLTLVGLIFLSLSLYRRIRYPKSSFFHWLRSFGGSRAQQRTEQGLIAFIEGNWAKAKRLLGRSAEKAENPLINYLAAAHAATEQGDTKNAEQFVKKAYANNKEAELAIGITQARIQLQNNELEPCLATLVRLRSQNEQHPYILKLLNNVYYLLEDWQQLAKLIPEQKRLEPEQKQALRNQEQEVWQKLFEQKAEDLLRKNDPIYSAEQLANTWKEAPESLRFNAGFIATYARQLISLNCQNEAEVLLRKALSKDWNEQLVELYGMAAGAKASEQLLTAENWLKQRPNDATLLLTLGRLALRNELWGKAWEYFSASHKLQVTQASLAELCRLAPHISENQEQNQALLNGLLNSLALPKLPTPK